jgi:hypothetical protein
MHTDMDIGVAPAVERKGLKRPAAADDDAEGWRTGDSRRSCAHRAPHRKGTCGCAAAAEQCTSGAKTVRVVALSSLRKFHP